MIIRQWCRTMILQSQGKYFFLRITDMVSRMANRFYVGTFKVAQAIMLNLKKINYATKNFKRRLGRLRQSTN
jgi:hypothetical protein